MAGFWPSNRKDKKEKKGEKKAPNSSKSSKNTQVQQQQYDETISPTSQSSVIEANDFNRMMSNEDGFEQLPSSRTKNKCVKTRIISFLRFSSRNCCFIHSQHLNHIPNQVQLFQLVVSIVLHVKVQYHFQYQVFINQQVQVIQVMMTMMIFQYRNFILKSIQQHKSHQ